MKAKILLLSIITVLSGCAGSLPDKEEMVTLNDGRTYEEQKYNSHEDGYVWHSSDLKKDEYQNIIVHDVNVHVSKTIDRLLTDQTVENFKQELKGTLSEKSSKLFPTDAASQHQAIVDVNIIKVEDIGEDVKAREIIPIGAIVALAKEAAGTRDRSVRLLVDVDIKDKDDGHLLARRIFVVNNNGVLENDKSKITQKILDANVNRITEQSVDFILHAMYM
ncbi:MULTISPECIES: DUF3313 family protein [Vibrio]|jgi:hypothetical protein|uniref:DUF3313 family protein n=1 Tax=Vibrio mediterranei TaxID=689 RepID=A0A3G4VG89_9VIBR|nr:MULTISPECIES: DUF3313 family protein [Vibrio]AYV23847.1 DUF3313 family protein [Vibrio mediterranei]EDL54876.1 hypothetical protein VSAK1_19159 [Vibrio mediterranei AK1]KFA95405.1 hypothetical protein HW45_26645 [Vibrio sp. ER1A]MCG9660855.1 DUF3313 domain-containing protein [Vibrio mediterranei]MCG9663419.1 DUF3313 domain-containing protein [Vibrio mediterranei]